MPFDPFGWTIATAGPVQPLDSRAVALDTSLGRITVTAPAPGVLRLRLGQTDGPDYGMLEPLIDAPIAAADGWIAGDGIALKADAAAGEPWRFALRRRAEVVLTSITDQHFRGYPRLPALARRDGRWLVSLALQADAPVYGLGELFGRLDRRGSTYAGVVADALGVNTGHAYKPMPFAWSPAGWGVIVHTPGAVIHHVGDPDWSHRTYALEVEDDGLDLLLVVGATPAEILERAGQLYGRPAAPPTWSFGVWASRAYYRTADEILAAADELRRRDFPCDVITFDGRAWLKVDTRCLLDWDESRYPDPEAVTRRLKAQGFRLCAWEYPYVSIHHPRFAELAARGWFLKERETGAPALYHWDPGPFGAVLTPLPTSGILDFTHPEVGPFWAERHRHLFAAGIDVMKTDFGEQVPIGDDVVAHNGDSGRRLHNVYTLLYNRCVFEATAELAAPEAPLVWARSAWLGSQRYPVHWGGDPQSDWEGLAASLRGGLSWGLSGGAFHATDIGGFYGDQPGPELYLRWVQAGVFASHFRFHGIGLREPWCFGEPAEAIARTWFRLRMRLIPYLEAAAAEAARTGLPVMRAMPLASPDDPAAWSFEHQFQCGPSLLVAPVLRPDGRVQVYLPRGSRWVDWWSGAVHDGGTLLSLVMPLERLPLFGRWGDVLPLGPAAAHTGTIDAGARVTARIRFGDAGPPPAATASA